MSDDKTLCKVYRLHARGGPPRTVDDALQRTATTVALRRRLVRQFAIPAGLVAAAMTFMLGESLIKDVIRNKAPLPSASVLGCEEASPRIYPTTSAQTYFEEQGNSAAFMPIGAKADLVPASAGCTPPRENL